MVLNEKQIYFLLGEITYLRRFSRRVGLIFLIFIVEVIFISSLHGINKSALKTVAQLIECDHETLY